MRLGFVPLLFFRVSIFHYSIFLFFLGLIEKKSLNYWPNNILRTFFYAHYCQMVSSNGLQLGEVAEIEAQMFSFAQKFNRRTELEFSTEPAILPNCCYLLCFFRLYIFYYEFNDFVFTLLNKFFRPS